MGFKVVLSSSSSVYPDHSGVIEAEALEDGDSVIGVNDADALDDGDNVTGVNDADALTVGD